MIVFQSSFQEKPSLKVLSLFDGLATGLFILDKLNCYARCYSYHIILTYFLRFLTGKGSSGRLFFDYHRILQLLSAAAYKVQRRFLWLYENTSHMEKKNVKEISK